MESATRTDPRPALRFVVVGTGRCGSSYLTNLLRDAGVPVDHEAVFTQVGPVAPGDLQGDVSWMAVPYLPTFPGAILHQVREPLAVVDSLLDLGLFAEPFNDEVHRPWRNFLEQHFQLQGEPLLDAMHFYVDWNARCEPYAQARVRIEDEGGKIADFFDELYPGTGERVLEQVTLQATDANSREQRQVTRTRAQGLRESDLPPGAIRDALLAMGERYGYRQ